MALRVYN